MALDGLGEVLASLLIFAQSATGYALPEDPPWIAFAPHAELPAGGMQRPCKIYGWYPRGKIIYLDDRLDPVHEVRARSILLHELVHYMQQVHGAFSGGSECENWSRREREAYSVQARWLAAKATPSSLYSGAGRAPWMLACGPQAEAVAPRDVQRKSGD